MLKYLDEGNALTGAALILAASALVPVVGKTLRPLAVLGIKGALSLADGTRTTLFLVKEEIEDIVAEAQFERIKRQLDKEVGSISTPAGSS
ncbi:MAG TPA: DUF5132 domain-containing protein [Desulfitobacteriaceae bacterium]|nr:DUF5132 domain-containing protein [Desulfitobacteriaceae bacterium]